MGTFKTLLFACLAINAASAHAEITDVCVSAFELAEQEQAPIAESASGRGVIGAGRLYFHTAPHKRCRSKESFVVAGDQLEAYADFGEFTRVIYWNPATGAGIAGWVVTARMSATEPRIAAALARRAQ